MQQALACGHMDQLNLPGLAQERKQVFPSGLAILIALFRVLNISGMTLSGGALREGVLYSMLPQLQHQDVRARTMQSMMVRYYIDQQHAERVADMAATLADQLHQQWNPKNSQFRYFGQPVAALVALLNWPGMLLTATVLSLLVSFRQSRLHLKFASDGYFSWPARWLLASGAAALNRNLAGPVYYQGQKIRRVRIGPAVEPQPADISLLLTLCRQYQVGVWLLLGSYLGLGLVASWPL